jgi:hypothetical protein
VPCLGCRRSYYDAYGRRGGHSVELVVGGRLGASSTHRRISVARSTELGHRGAPGGRQRRRRRAWDSDGKLVGGISVLSLHPVSRSRAPLMSESASARVVGVRTHPHELPVSELVLVHARAAGRRARPHAPPVDERCGWGAPCAGTTRRGGGSAPWGVPQTSVVCLRRRASGGVFYWVGKMAFTYGHGAKKRLSGLQFAMRGLLLR